MATLAILLTRSFGAPIPSLSVREMELNGWAALNGRVFPRWTHAGACRRQFDPTIAALDSLSERADLERHAPPQRPWSEMDFEAVSAKADALADEWEQISGRTVLRAVA